MNRAHLRWRPRLAAVFVLLSLLLLLFAVPGLPAGIALASSNAPNPCGHILRAANGTAGPEVECFLNATAGLTFDPNQLVVPANSTIVFHVGDVGGIPHTFTLDNVSNDSTLASWTQAPNTVSPAQLYKYFASHEAVNLTLDGSATGNTSSPVTLPTAHGVYYYVCLVPGHFQSGMYGELVMGLPKPIPSVAPTLNVPVQFGIVALAFVALAAAAIIIFNAQSFGGIRRGFVKLFETEQADPNSLRSWLFTTDHKRIGILYLATSIFFFFMAGSFALMMRTQLSVPNNTFVNAQVYNQLVTMHGLLMALFVLSPLGFAFANYIIPLQMGAKDMSFPRLNALSYWFFALGGFLLLSGIFLPGGAVSSGWTLYAPLNETPYLPQPGMDVGILGILMLCISVVLGTTNIFTTVFRQRVKGYKLLDLPMFTWGILFTLIMAWIAFPDLMAAVVLLMMDRAIGSEIFLANVGGTLLWQQVFWFFGHPEVYILIFPAFGAMYDIASVFSGQPIFGKRYVIYSMAAIVILSMAVWLHHMFMTGVNLGWIDLQSFTTQAISIPSDTLVLGLIFTMAGGNIRYKSPMLFTLGAIPLFIIGGITGVLTGVPALDVGFHGTYWVVGHFHYMLAGTALWGLTAATYFYYPKVTGRMPNENIAKVHLGFAAFGVNMIYFPMLLLYNMPRRYFVYSANLGFNDLNLISTIGAYIYATAQLIFLANLLYSWKRGQVASRNPWQAWGFEWLTSSPPPAWNFDGDPTIRGTRMSVEPSMEHPHPPHLSKWPMFIGVGSFLSLFGLVVQLYWGNPILLVLGLVLVILSMAGWAWEDFADRIPEMDHGTRELWPFGSLSNVQFGTIVFISGDLAFVGAMVGAYAFTTWQAAYFSDPLLSLAASGSTLLTELILLSLVGSIALAMVGLYGARSRNLALAETGIVGTIVLGGLFLVASVLNWQTLTNSGMGMSTVGVNLTTSMFYDFSIIHIVHVVALIGVMGYFAVRVPKLFELPDHSMGPDGNKAGSPFDGLAAATYLWVFIAAFGIVLTAVFLM